VQRGFAQRFQLDIPGREAGNHLLAHHAAAAATTPTRPADE